MSFRFGCVRNIFPGEWLSPQLVWRLVWFSQKYFLEYFPLTVKLFRETYSWFWAKFYSARIGFKKHSFQNVLLFISYIQLKIDYKKKPQTEDFSPKFVSESKQLPKDIAQQSTTSLRYWPTSQGVLFTEATFHAVHCLEQRPDDEEDRHGW